ncbi:MAG: Rdx family protein [Dehalococcoidales bacterium]|nr:MAG: Rdx family protein [Dehalococcoidales bacterium]
MQKAFEVKANLVPGGGGIFDVIVDDVKVYSKHDTGRFPEPGEVVSKIK